VEYTDAGITLTMRGIAARNGSLGDRVPVRVDSGKRLEGTVIAPGRIRID
jgi:flagella basal body P-ring formation protein FlgA